MTVKRIVSNIAVTSVDDVRAFYSELFDLDVVMDHGWIATLASGETAPTQISIAIEGGSGTAVPDLSIEVDDVDALYQRAKRLGHKIEYELTNEPWGVRRFYMLDPTGKLLSILAHPA
ncbi:VOC family protein [Boseongicola sp. H5]|uniref:VOC family protein n=1 Tax=Boseongicola sp. H5 TaxID=2763261 RepID=UPI001D0A7407|nr:VOC family protein [Boseongicola sp. H5]